MFQASPSDESSPPKQESSLPQLTKTHHPFFFVAAFAAALAAAFAAVFILFRSPASRSVDAVLFLVFFGAMTVNLVLVDTGRASVWQVWLHDSASLPYPFSFAFSDLFRDQWVGYGEA